MPLYVRVTPEFDPTTFEGLLVAFEDVGSAMLFTENGYDAFDHEDEPRIHEISLTTNALATRTDVEAACCRLGIPLVMTEDEKSAAFGGAVPEGDIAAEGTELNQILEREDVRAELEAMGFAGARGHVVIENTEPEATMLWKPGTFEVGERLAVSQGQWGWEPSGGPRP